MKLYLVQHAEAKSEEEDPDRPLSEKGLNDIKRMTQFLKGKIKIAGIFHSGKLRAKQTAETLNEAVMAEVKAAEGLAPNDDVRIWAEKVKNEKEDIMLVGHLPHLKRLAGLLLADDEDKKVVDFKMGGVVCLERDEGSKWSIQWIVTPAIFNSKF